MGLLLPEHFWSSTMLLVVMLNPFLMSIYLMDLIENLDARRFRATLNRGVLIATVVFAVFAIGGDALFSEVFRVRFASFQIFGGMVFLIIGMRFVFEGPEALARLRGSPEHLAGSIAMPFMVGPGTVSASVVAGMQQPLPWALVSIASAMFVTVSGLLAIKWLHGYVKDHNVALLDRYVNLVGRASALLIGTISVDMILNGVEMWWNSFNAA